MCGSVGDGGLVVVVTLDLFHLFMIRSLVSWPFKGIFVRLWLLSLEETAYL